MDFRAADNFGFFFGKKKISLGNVMICGKTNTNYRQKCLGFYILRGNNFRLGVRFRTSRMGVANLERSRTTMEAEKKERRKNRKQDNDNAVCVSNVCDRICRSSFGLYNHQRK